MSRGRRCARARFRMGAHARSYLEAYKPEDRRGRSCLLDLKRRRFPFDARSNAHGEKRNVAGKANDFQPA